MIGRQRDRGLRPKTSPIPTLLISGGRDPATPAYLADLAARGLSHAERYNDPVAGHAALDDRARDRMAVFFARSTSSVPPT